MQRRIESDKREDFQNPRRGETKELDPEEAAGEDLLPLFCGTAPRNLSSVCRFSLEVPVDRGVRYLAHSINDIGSVYDCL